MRAIAAMGLNRVIGNKGKIPWHIPEDFRWFKEFTMNKTLVMGRTTFETLPPLKNRNIVVLSNTITDPVAYHVRGRTKCKELFLRDSNTFKINEFENMILAGGAKTYEALLPHCTDVYLTIVLDEYDGDTFMPEFEHLFPNSDRIREEKEFWIVRYTK